MEGSCVKGSTNAKWSFFRLGPPLWKVSFFLGEIPDVLLDEERPIALGDHLKASKKAKRKAKKIKNVYIPSSSILVFSDGLSDCCWRIQIAFWWSLVFPTLCWCFSSSTPGPRLIICLFVLAYLTRAYSFCLTPPPTLSLGRHLWVNP